MLKETGYQEKFEILNPWITEIIEIVKKDLKNEHLKIDREFCKRFFLGKNPNQLTVQEIADAYRADIENGNVGLGEFIATRWLLKNTDIYGYFEDQLKKITANFEELDVLPEEVASPLMEASIKQFGAKKTYVFSIFNSVVFSSQLFEKLRKKAETETEELREIREAEELAHSIESLQRRHAREMNAVQDRFEKKLSGMQKKYLRDTEALKKQIKQLQRKLSDGA